MKIHLGSENRMSGKYSKGGKKLGDAISLTQKTSIDGQKTEATAESKIESPESKATTTIDSAPVDASTVASNANGSPETSQGKKTRKRKKDDEVRTH